jgi:hypothetical protein
MLLPELGAFLASAGAGTVSTNLFYGSLPDSPDNCTALYEYPGEPPQGVLGPSAVWDHEYPHVQVRHRNTSYAAGRLAIELYFTAMATVINRSLSGVYYVGAECLQSPFSLGKDENGRWHFAFNVRICKALSSS